MRKPTKFLALTEQRRERSEQLWHESPAFRVRQRAHALPPSCRDYTANQIADIFGVQRDTVTARIDSRREHGEEGLNDDPRSGAPSNLSDAERDRAVGLLKEHPRQPTKVLGLIEAETGKSISADTLARIARRAGLVWKRMRRSCKSNRDEDEFRQARQESGGLADQHERGESGLYYFDESGFSCQPCVPHGRQEVGQTTEIDSQHSKRLNVPGFLGSRQEFEAYTRGGRVDTSVVVECIDSFRENLGGPAVLVLDNAPVHTGKAFKCKIPEWSRRGLELYYLPTYSPELNWIEILWRGVKYHWLPLRACKSYKALKKCVVEILEGVGKTHLVNAESSAA